VCIGVHCPTRRIVLQFDVPKSCQDAKRVFSMILGKGGDMDRRIEDCSVFDLFHAENWG
jgi:hypothetical protein